MSQDGVVNGNGRSSFQKFLLESAGFSVAEMVSIGVSLGVIAVADQVAPSLLKTASRCVSKTCIEPHLDTIERSLKKVCKLEECQPDQTKSREERAENLAHTLILFSAAWVAAMASKIATRRAMIKLSGELVHRDPAQRWYGLSSEEKLIMTLDEGVHYGSLLLFNTGAAKHTDAMINATSSMLQSCGVPEKKAKEISGMAMIWELPNVLGMVAGMAGIYHNHHKGRTTLTSHVERLAAQTSLSSTKLVP